MSLTEVHREQIRALVDAVDDPLIADVMSIASIRSTPSRHRRVGVAAAASAVLVAAALLAGAAFVLRDDHSSPPARVHPAEPPTTPAGPESCYVVAEDFPGCEMSPAEASIHLAFAAREPVVPDGWVVERQRLLLYGKPEGDNAEGFYRGGDPVPVYNQIWTQPGVDLDTATNCPARLQIRQRPMSPGEQGSGPSLDLAGQQVFGSLTQPGACGDDVTVSTNISWYDDGIAFTLIAIDVDREDVIRAVESLSGS